MSDMILNLDVGTMLLEYLRFTHGSCTRLFRLVKYKGNIGLQDEQLGRPVVTGLDTETKIRLTCNSTCISRHIAEKYND